MIVAAESGFLYWVSIADFEIAYAKDTETKGVFAATFTPDYSSFVFADLSSTLVHAQARGHELKSIIDTKSQRIFANHNAILTTNNILGRVSSIFITVFKTSVETTVLNLVCSRPLCCLLLTPIRRPQFAGDIPVLTEEAKQNEKWVRLTPIMQQPLAVNLFSQEPVAYGLDTFVASNRMVRHVVCEFTMRGFGAVYLFLRYSKQLLMA